MVSKKLTKNDRLGILELDSNLELKKFQRKRSGCTMCKKRKKKCGEERPLCASCIRLNLQCSYSKQLLWHNCNQHNSPQIPIRAKYNKLSFLNSTTTDLSLSFYLSNTDHYESHMRQKFQINGSYNEHLLSFGSNSNIETDLFQYYISNLSKRRAFGDCKDNEFRSLIVPNCYHSPALFQSVIALLANDMSRKRPEESLYYSALMIKYKNEAISLLHNMLDSQPQFINSESSVLEMVITILMLCSLEISDKGNKNWVNHLQEGGMIFRLLNYSKILNSGMLLFLYRYFTLRYILLLTTLNQDELHKTITAQVWPLIDKFFDSDRVDYMLGCSPRLLHIIYQITILRLKKIESWSSQYNTISKKLLNLTQVLSKSDQNSQGLLLCSQLYYESAKVYLHSSFHNSIDEIEQPLQLTLTVFDKLVSRVGENPIHLMPLWSLFIVSTCRKTLNDDLLKLKIIDIFEHLEIYWPQGSLYQIKLAIEVIWKIDDLSDTEIDWKDILSVTGFKLALT